MIEKRIESCVCDFIKTKGGIAYKFVSPARRSVPDRMVLLQDRPAFFIEFKTKTGKLTSGQVREINRLRDLGQKVYVVDDVEVGKSIVRKHLNGRG